MSREGTRPLQMKDPLSYRMGDKAGVREQLLDAGFGQPNQLQTQRHFGDNSSDGQPYVAEGKRKEMNQGEMEQVAAAAAGAVGESIAKKIKEAAAGGIPQAGGLTFQQAQELITGALAANALANREHTKAAALEVALKTAELTKAGAFDRSRVAKAEDAGWQALGIATGVTLGGVAVFALKKSLAL